MSRYPAGQFGAKLASIGGVLMGMVGVVMVLVLNFWGFVVIFGGMLLLAIAAATTAIFDIADRYLAEPEKIVEEPEPETEPKPGPEHEPEPEPEPEAQRPPAMPYGITDMDESTARRIAEEDERKFKGKQ